jgi:hypothetical protein
MKKINKQPFALVNNIQPQWQRIFLLIVLGYEAAGALLGGSLLIASPDGKYMDMPVDMMNGTFVDFLIPGFILFGLGILNTVAFIAVLRRDRKDWFMAGLGLGGLFIWFLVEIAILHDLHWLHAMWGLPVLLGWVVLIPLIALRNDPVMMRKILLTCGVLSTVWYLFLNIFVPMHYEGYSSITYTISELSAIGAPTRILWVLMCILYPLLYIAFGWGVVQVASGSRSLRLVGVLIILHGIMNFYWPPMHTRETLAAGGGTISDNLHLGWAMMTLLANIVLMWFGAKAIGGRFRIYTIATFVLFLIFGTLVFRESPGIEANLPTPGIGLWERINIFAFMTWIAVLAIMLLRREKVEVKQEHKVVTYRRPKVEA